MTARGVQVLGEDYRTLSAEAAGALPPALVRVWQTDRDDVVVLREYGPVMTVTRPMMPSGAVDLADQLREAAGRPAVEAVTVLAWLEGHYREAINAVVAAPGGVERDPDVDRWRGHAEAARAAAVLVRRLAGLPPVDMTSREWRAANGVRSG